MKSKARLTIILAVPIALAVIAFPLYRLLHSQTADQSEDTLAISASTTIKNDTVNALGRIEPKDEVIQLAGPSHLFNGRIIQLLVQEGDKVKHGQVIAILDNFKKQQAILEEAKQKVKVARARLAQVKAGEAKIGEIAAQEANIANVEAQFNGEVATEKARIARLKAELFRQKDAQEATIARLKAEWNNAKTECLRYETLLKDGAVTTSTRDSKCLEAKTAREELNEKEANRNRIIETLQQEINEAQATLNKILSTFPQQILQAKATLNKLKEVRPVDMQVAQAELSEAIAAVAEAEADLELAYVRAPVDGEILKINTFAGESISSEGIVDLAQTHEMYVVAEVFETDINQIRIGQIATVYSSALADNLKGTVQQISSEIGKKDVFNSDPTLDIDARVFEVKIRLEPSDSKQAARLINSQVDVEISTSS
ncbi:MAG: ABC exporter membrane fusion protein [Xenococcaceae cyanobacterium]